MLRPEMQLVATQLPTSPSGPGAACVRAAPPTAKYEEALFSLTPLIACGITVPYALHDSLLLPQSPDLDQELSARQYCVMRQSGTVIQNIGI